MLYIYTYTLYIHTLPQLQPWSTATSLCWHHPPAAPSHIAHGCLARHSPWSAGLFLRMGVPCVQGISLGSHTNNIYVCVCHAHKYIYKYLYIYIFIYLYIYILYIYICYMLYTYHLLFHCFGFPKVCFSRGDLRVLSNCLTIFKSESSPWTQVYVQTSWPKMGLPTRITHLASQDLPLDCLELHRPCNSQVSGFKLAHNLWESSRVEYVFKTPCLSPMCPHMPKIDTPFLNKSISPIVASTKKGSTLPDLTAAAWHLGWWKLLIGLAFPANRC